MYRMLGREHEADLEREALKWRRAAEVRERTGADAAAAHDDRLQRRVHLVVARIAAFVGRAARVEASMSANSNAVAVAKRPTACGEEAKGEAHA